MKYITLPFFLVLGLFLFGQNTINEYSVAAPCPQFTASSYVKNGNPCGIDTIVALLEDFEGPSGVGYTPTGVFSDGLNDYFDLIGDLPDPTGVPIYTGANGTQFWAGEDTQDLGNPNATGISTISITGISIAGLSNLQFNGLFAAGSFTAYDDPDFLQISIQIDGGGYNLLGAFEGAGGFNTALLQDTDLDGFGDGTTLGLAFQNINFPISATGASLDIQLDVFMTAGDEAVAIDSLSITGESPITCIACESDLLTFSVDGTDLPQGGSIDWYYSLTPSFDPYSGDGTLIGSTTIPLACSSASIVINEVDYRPTTNNGQNPNAGESIELLGPPGTDLSCYVLTDGDWTLTFPAGSTIPVDGIFTIGNDVVHGAGTFDLDAESCVTCFTDGAAGDGLLLLTDGGEYIALFDNAGTFVQGLIYGSPSAANTPPLGSNVVAGVINTIGTIGCPASVTIPAAASFETAAGGVAAGTTLIRSPDGNGAWTTQVGGSINDCNAASATVPDFDYTIPMDACNETRIYKGIFNPHPNSVTCLNTDASASTDEFTIQQTCPSCIVILDNELISFDVELIQEDVKLEWEWNPNSYTQNFEIEHSTDAIHFSNIGLRAQSNNYTLNAINYNFLDTHPSVGLNYYRIKYPSSEGSKYSEIKSALVSNTSPSATIYPNPTKGNLHLKFSHELNVSSQLKITNTLGNVVSSYYLPKGATYFDIDLEELTTSIYMLSFEMNGEQINLKVIKN